jgi:serine/threonine protein kinase
MSLAAGTRLGPYEVLGLIGAGSMGEVYKARDTRLDRSVALKILPTELSADPDPSTLREPQGRREPGRTATGSGSSRAKSRGERLARFRREAELLASLAHPHICTLFDIGEHLPSGSLPLAPRPLPLSPIHYLVMEHLAGETLAQRLRRGPVPLAQALDVAAQIAEALDAAHKHGIVHRDLKPGNVMLTTGGAGRTGVTSAKLLDFGLAKLTAHGERPALVSEASALTQTAPVTARGTILGTLPYMAPEQLEGTEADARTNLWAFGAVLYEMVTGRRAFEGQSQVSLIGNIMNTAPPALATLQPLTPPALERVVRKCLAKAPDDRWDTAHDVADELRWIAQTSSGSTTAPGGALTVAPGHRLRWRPVAAGIAGLVGLVSLTVWLAPRIFPRPPGAAGASGIRSVAVLPFDNLMHDAAQELMQAGRHTS